MVHSRATANVPSRKFAANVEESRYGVRSTGVAWDGPARRRRPMQEQQTVPQRPTMAIVNPIIRLHEADNVVVARATLLPGTPRLHSQGGGRARGDPGRGGQRALSPVL